MTAAILIEWLLTGSAIAILAVILIMGAQVVQAALRGRIDALDLVIGKNGRISDEKVWTHLGKAVLLYAMIKDTADGQPDAVLQAALFVPIAAHEYFIRRQAHRENPLDSRPAPTTATTGG